MAREVTWGTPARTDRLPPLRGSRPLRALGAAFGVAVLALLLLLHGAGWREVASPGPVTSLHAMSEDRCEECHAGRGRLADLRCQRCHDSAGGARHDLARHVLFGSGDPEMAEASAERPCASCHVEHGGRDARLADVDGAHCASCHFPSFADHPELRARHETAGEQPGLAFSHEAHLKRILEQQGHSTFAACASCHPPSGPDLEPVSFDRHCASCHEKNGSLGATDPVLPADVFTPQSVAEFQASGERIVKVTVRHRDEWVLSSLARLRSDLDSFAVLSERGALEARLSRLRRRLSRMAPPASLELAALRAREAENAAELVRIEARATASPTGATGSDWTLDALALIQDLTPEAGALREKARGAQAVASPSNDAELALRRAELQAVLSALDAADPGLRGHTEDLRRRLLALRAGDTSPSVLARARRQRLGEQDRLRDEIALREGGVPPSRNVGLAREEAMLHEAMVEAEGRLTGLAAPVLERASDDTVVRKLASRDALSAPCLTCHILEAGALVSPAPARPVLVHTRFPHQPHLAHASCETCHAGIERSTAASDLAVPSMGVCRECHARGEAPSACLSCHVYHPRAVP